MTFSGSTRVSQFFAQCGYRVISNDIAVWSKVIGTCYLQNQKERKTYTELIEHLNLVKSRDGWFTEHYGGEPNGGCSVQKDGTKRPSYGKKSIVYNCHLPSFKPG